MFRVGRRDRERKEVWGPRDRQREREREREGEYFSTRYVSSKEIKRIMLSKVIVHAIA